MRKRVVAGSIAVSVALVAAPAQAATTRYAAPSGADTDCTQPAPCSVERAVEWAGNGDTIEVGAGIYFVGLDNIVATATGLTVEGPSPQNKPIISGLESNVLTMSNGGTVRDLELRAAGGGGSAFGINGGVAERLDVRSEGSACSVGGGATLRDSVCYASGSGVAGVLVSSSSALLANVTAIAPGTNSAGLSVGGGGTVTGTNVIAQGGFRAALANGAGSTITLDHSDYATEYEASGGAVTNPGSGTNITAPPVFVDASVQDYRQDVGSPTIDAGAASPSIGSFDLEGDARTLGPAPDIGADERVPPVVTPPADTAPPETTIDKGPRKKGKSKKATFEFSSSETGSTFTCRVDKKAEAPCTSPLKLEGLKKGKHSLTVVATDAAGNADASPASYSWKVKKKSKKNQKH